MAISNAKYDAIMREYEDRQTKNRHLLEERSAYVKEHVPGYKQLSDQIASVCVMQGRKLLEGDTSALTKLHETVSELSAQKKQLLAQASLPADYLDPIYDCPDCKDTERIGDLDL